MHETINFQSEFLIRGCSKYDLSPRFHSITLRLFSLEKFSVVNCDGLSLRVYGACLSFNYELFAIKLTNTRNADKKKVC